MDFAPPPVNGRHPDLEDFRRFATQVFGERVFARRYERAFDWFSDAVSSPQSVLNIGCSSGRETLALQWAFGVENAVGLDINRPALADAGRVIKYIQRFNRRFYRHILPRVSAEDEARRLRSWYEAGLPAGFRSNRLPAFQVTDLARRIPLAPASVDLVYGRYVLFQIFDTAPANVARVLENIRRVLRPGGQLALVEPTRREQITYDFEADFRQAGFRRVMQAGAAELGFLEWPATAPQGALWVRED